MTNSKERDKPDQLFECQGKDHHGHKAPGITKPNKHTLNSKTGHATNT